SNRRRQAADVDIPLHQHASPDLKLHSCARHIVGTHDERPEVQPLGSTGTATVLLGIPIPMQQRSFSTRILWGLAAGIFTGLFLGERAVILKSAADGFVKLLQMTVLPYVIVSIVSSLGRLRHEEVHALGRRIAAVVGALWIMALTFALLIPV